MVAIPMPAGAQTVIGILTSVTGRVTVVRPGSTAVPLKARDTLSLGELITVVKLRERTRLSVDQTARRTILFLVDGAVAVAAPIAWQVDRRDIFEIRTRHAVAQSRGRRILGRDRGAFGHPRVRVHRHCGGQRPWRR